MNKGSSGLYFLFQFGESTYGIPASQVVEVTAVHKLIPAVCYPEIVLGILDLRGKMFALLDTGLLINKEKLPYGSVSLALIVSIAEDHFALAIDSALRVININSEEMSIHEDSLVYGSVSKGSDTILLLDLHNLNV